MQKDLISSKRFIYALLVISVFAGYLLLRDYFQTIVLAFILGYLFQPLNFRIARRLRNNYSIATIISVLLVILLVLVPVTLVGIVTFNQLITILKDLDQFTKSSGVTLDYILTIVNDLNRVFPFLNISVTQTDISNFLLNTIEPLGNLFVQYSFKIGSSTVAIIIRILLFFSIFSALINKLPELIESLKKLSPLPDEIDETYINRVEAMTSSMVKGIFIIAIIQGTVTGISMYLVGVNYVFFWSMLATLFSIVPLGSGLIVWPIGLVLIATGNPWAGIIIIVVNVLITSNIDNVLRPLLASPQAHLHPVLTLLGLLGGLELFGFLGIVIGPIMMIFIVTTFEIYQKYYAGISNTR